MSQEEKDRHELAREIAREFMAMIYVEVGKSILKKVFWMLVAAGAGLAIATGALRVPHL